jgi:hypothetical protein
VPPFLQADLEKIGLFQLGLQVSLLMFKALQVQMVHLLAARVHECKRR